MVPLSGSSQGKKPISTFDYAAPSRPHPVSPRAARAAWSARRCRVSELTRTTTARAEGWGHAPADRLGVIAMTVAICCCVLLGTVGWFAVGFGTMTDCTNSYSCSTQSCQPCAVAGRWINVGGIAQWLLAGLGVGSWSVVFATHVSPG